MLWAWKWQWAGGHGAMSSESSENTDINIPSSFDVGFLKHILLYYYCARVDLSIVQHV